MQLVQTRVGKVAVEICGKGEPLVMLHGAGHDRHDFDGIVPSLSKQYQTIAVDWPGQGESEMLTTPANADVPLMCDALEDVIDSLSLPPALFIGNSLGGTALVRLAARRPDRVRGLVLVDSGGLFLRTLQVRAFCWLLGHEWVLRRFGMAFASFYLKVNGEARTSALARIERLAQRPGAVALLAAMWRSFGDGTGDVRAEAGRVRCPTLLIWGKHDPVARAKIEGAQARALLKRAEYIELDTGHVPFLEAPSAFLDAVTPFLGKTAASG